MVIYLSGWKTAGKNPGVAKFGIALEWGSRGLEFESRHSDQKERTQVLSFFLLCVKYRTRGLLYYNVGDVFGFSISIDCILN